jgi:DNA-binding MarR family transcriptional regulator
MAAENQPFVKFDMQKNQIGYLLHQVDKYVFRRQNDALKSYGINFNCAIALNFIVEHEDAASINQRAIESFTGLTNPAITKIISALVELGLVVRQPDAIDRRNYKLLSTEAGREKSAICRQLIIDTDKDCFSDLDHGRQVALVELLTSINTDRI